MNTTRNRSTSLSWALGPSSSDSVRLSVLSALAKLLDEAHLKGQVHGDFNPDRVTIEGNPATEPFNLRIDGFGAHTQTDADLVSADSIPPAAYYFSPERILGLEVTALSDQFSLAVLAFESVCETLPFNGDSAAELFRRICNDPPVSVAQPDSVVRVLKRGLAKEGQLRYPTCSAFLDELAAGLNSAPAIPFVIPRSEMPGSAGTAAAAAPALAPIAQPVIDPVLERQRRRLGLIDEPAPVQPRRHAPPKFVAVGALLGLAILVLLLFHHEPTVPHIPQQTLDTRSAPTVPPPAEPAPAPVPQAPAPPIAQPQPPRVFPPRVQVRPGKQPKPPKSSNYVQFSGGPSGSRITVDHDPSESCQLPCSLPLTPGRHTFVAESSGYRQQQGILHVPEDRKISVGLSKAVGVVVITSEPPGASVVIDGHARGQTPLHVQLSVGSHSIMVSIFGLRRQATVDVQPDSLQSKRFMFE